MIPGYLVYTRVYICITVLVIWYYRIIMITTRLLFILIMILLPLSPLSPLQSSLHRYHLYYRYRETRGAYALQWFSKWHDTRARLTHECVYTIYNIHITIAIVACATIWRGWHDNDDSERDFEVAPVCPFVVEAIRSMNARKSIGVWTWRMN